MYMTTKEVCDLLRITEPTLNDWCKQGKLSKIKLNRRVLFSRNEVDRFLKESTVNE